jgi:hypothetical protein
MYQNHQWDSKTQLAYTLKKKKADSIEWGKSKEFAFTISSQVDSMLLFQGQYREILLSTEQTYSMTCYL